LEREKAEKEWLSKRCDWLMVQYDEQCAQIRSLLQQPDCQIYTLPPQENSPPPKKTEMEPSAEVQRLRLKLDESGAEVLVLRTKFEDRTAEVQSLQQRLDSRCTEVRDLEQRLAFAYNEVQTAKSAAQCMPAKSAPSDDRPAQSGVDASLRAVATSVADKPVAQFPMPTRRHAWEPRLLPAQAKIKKSEVKPPKATADRGVATQRSAPSLLLIPRRSRPFLDSDGQPIRRLSAILESPLGSPPESPVGYSKRS